MFQIIFTSNEPDIRYINEVIFGKCRGYTYGYLTNSPITSPQNTTSYIMTNIPNIEYSEIANTYYGKRTWAEYGSRQCKSELGRADFRFTRYEVIACCWEVIFCIFLMIDLNSSSTIRVRPVAYSIVKDGFKNCLSEHPN
jgi:hypothetical protein